MEIKNIKNALEKCSVQEDCNGCRYEKYEKECIAIMLQDALAAINSQQEEIYRYHEKLQGAIAEQQILQGRILILRRELDDATNCRILERATTRKLIFNETCTLNILHQECTGEPLDCNCCTMECEFKKGIKTDV